MFGVENNGYELRT